MKVKKTLVPALLAIASCIAGLPSHAASHRMALTAKASTLGLGADLAFSLASRVDLRVIGQGLDYSRTDSVDGVDYDTRLGLRSFGALVDVRPFKGSFYVSAGLLANGNDVESVARLDPAASYDIGGSTFTGAELGRMDGTAKFDATAPYAGLGWGNPFARERRLGFAFGLGVIHQGKPDVTMTSTNPTNNPLLPQNLQDEERQMEEELARLEYFPVVSLGLSYRF